MKKILVSLALLTGAATLFAGNGIVVTQKYNSGNQGRNITVTWYVTPTQCKLKMQYSDKDVNTNTYFIPSGGQLLTYNDGPVPSGATKAYFAVPVGNIKAKQVSNYTVERTGEVKTIAGAKCEKVIARSGFNVTEIWVSQDFKGEAYRFAPYFQSNAELKALSDAGIPGFPVASVTKDAGGNVVSSYEAVSVSNTDISDAEFTVPAEYKNAAEIKTGK
ncbi:MAG TPA: DUF4412 domain-containing protein [Chitinophagales bacterium]|nr:DUF4412 domain-containing protein [Chitinophagales bacterium]